MIHNTVRRAFKFFGCKKTNMHTNKWPTLRYDIQYCIFNIIWILEENRNDFSPATGCLRPPTVFFISLKSNEFLRNYQRGWHCKTTHTMPRKSVNGSEWFCIHFFCMEELRNWWRHYLAYTRGWPILVLNDHCPACLQTIPTLTASDWLNTHQWVGQG